MRISRWLAVLATVLLFAACGGDNEPNGDTQIRVVNTTGETIFSILFSNCDDINWGEDRLDDDEVVETGTERSFDVNDGCYDIRADFDLNGADQQTIFAVEIEDGEIFDWEPSH
jgi:hypothetical protein